MRNLLLSIVLWSSAIVASAAVSSAQSFSYDAAGRLTRVTYPGGTTITYGFDANGDPVSSVVTPTPPSGGGGGGGGGGCFVATAAYGSALDPHVQALRDVRERWLRPHLGGRIAIALYESASPPLAAWIAEREWARSATRWLLAPLVYSAAYPSFALPAWALAAAIACAWWRRRRTPRSPALATR
jgi:YD repeat-containing protein